MNTTQAQLFRNPFLEKLTKSTPRLTIIFYIFLIAIFLFLEVIFTGSGSLKILEFYIGGLLSWTFMEYILHRYIFHINEYIPFLKRFHYIIHGVHHEQPRDPERLFMPPIPGTIIAFLIFSFWYLFFGLDAFAFTAGISNGYLFYSYIHYTIHTDPSNRYLRKLCIHHAKHHYKYPNKAYGVSSPLWDIVFGTMPPKR